MGNDVPTKNENNKPINGDASALISAAKEALGFNINWNTAYVIDSDEKVNLEKMDETLKNAKIIVHKDGKGATVLSSSGAVVIVGTESPAKNYEDMSEKEKAEYKLTLKQTSFAFGEAVELLNSGLNSGGSITKEAREKLENLNKILPDISIMVTDDGKGVIVADSEGRHLEAGSASNAPGVYVGNLLKPVSKQR